MRTFISWQGNKSKHINKFKHLIPDEYNTYIEPFVGSGAMLLRLRPKKWIINDINKDLIGIWKIVRDNSNMINSEFEKFKRNISKMSKSKIKELCKKITTNLEYIEYNENRYIYYLMMSNMSYTGTIINNNKFYFKGISNSILNDYYPMFKDNYYNNINNVSSFINASINKILNTDYKNVLKHAKSGDFVFLDPPYIEEHYYQFNYNKNENVNNEFIEELLLECDKLNKKGVKWMMTQADTKEINTLFKDYNIYEYKVYRSFSGVYKNEIIITNY